jgi:lactate permease
VSFAVPQFLVSNFHGPWLVDIISGACSILALVLLMRVWKPRELMTLERPQPEALDGSPDVVAPVATGPQDRKLVLLAWMPWAILTAFILCWGLPATKNALNKITASKEEIAAHPDKVSPPKVAVPSLHQRVQRMPPVAPEGSKPEAAEFKLDFISATGTGILLAAIVAGFAMGFSPGTMLRTYGHTIWKVRFSLLTIAAMLALGNVTKYSGTDATLGLALAHTGQLYPFFGTLLGWLGVALTGSDTASNVLFGSLQKITAEQLGISAILMGAANSSGGVMGKMIDAQSIVVASTATNWYGHEGAILRYVFWHSIALAALMGVLVYLQAYIPPFTEMVVK